MRHVRGNLAATVMVALSCLLLAACGGSSGDEGNGGGDNNNDGSGTIGASGGSVSLPSGPTLQIPAGALAASTPITISASTVTAPSGAITSVWEFGPSGTTFATPVTVTFPVPAGTTAATAAVYWGKSGGSGQWDVLATTVSGTEATAQVTHFTPGFVGAACAPGATCTPANPCHTGVTTCNGTPACADSGTSVADGTACGSGLTCSAGSCGSSGSSLVGVWSGSRGGVSGTLTFNANGTFSGDNQSTAGVDVTGTYQATASQLSVVDTGGPQACPQSQVGVYGYAISGSTLTVTLVSDACVGRSLSLPGTYSQGAAACNSIPLDAPNIYPTVVPQTLPSATGGSIVEGTYDLVKQTYYSGPGGSSSTDSTSVAHVWVLSGGIGQHAYRSPSGVFRYTDTYSVSGTNLMGAQTCGPDPRAYPPQPFTATSTEIHLFVPGQPGKGDEYVFRLRGTSAFSANLQSGPWATACYVPPLSSNTSSDSTLTFTETTVTERSWTYPNATCSGTGTPTVGRSPTVTNIAIGQPVNTTMGAVPVTANQVNWSGPNIPGGTYYDLFYIDTSTNPWGLHIGANDQVNNGGSPETRPTTVSTDVRYTRR